MEAIEKRIITTSSELFFKHGLRNVTMDDIAHKLGISKKTLYQYYKDKNEIVSTITQQTIECNCEEQNLIASQSKNAIDEMMQIMAYTKKFFTEIHPSYTLELQKYFPNAWDCFIKYKEEYIHKKIKNNLLRGIKEGLYRDDINIDLVIHHRMDGIEAAFRYASETKCSLAEVHTQLLELSIYGVCSLKGYKMFEKYKQPHPASPKGKSGSTLKKYKK